MLRKVCAPARDKETGGWRKLRYVLFNSSLLSHDISVKNLWWARFSVRVGRWEM